MVCPEPTNPDRSFDSTGRLAAVFEHLRPSKFAVRLTSSRRRPRVCGQLVLECLALIDRAMNFHHRGRTSNKIRPVTPENRRRGRRTVTKIKGAVRPSTPHRFDANTHPTARELCA